MAKGKDSQLQVSLRGNQFLPLQGLKDPSIKFYRTGWKYISLSELPFFNFIDVLHHTHRNFIKMCIPATEVRVLQALGE